MISQFVANVALENMTKSLLRMGVAYSEVTAKHGSTITMIARINRSAVEYTFSCGEYGFYTINRFEAIRALSNALEVA